jgi:hypothetical protein
MPAESPPKRYRFSSLSPRERTSVSRCAQMSIRIHLEAHLGEDRARQAEKTMNWIPDTAQRATTTLCGLLAVVKFSVVPLFAPTQPLVVRGRVDRRAARLR